MGRGGGEEKIVLPRALQVTCWERRKRSRRRKRKKKKKKKKKIRIKKTVGKSCVISYIRMERYS